MNRRQFLTSAGVGLFTATAGCLSNSEEPPEGNDDLLDNPTPSGEDGQPLAESRDIIIENFHAASQEVSVVLYRDEAVIHTVAREVASDESIRLEGVVTETGAYTVEASLPDGTRDSVEWPVYEGTWDAYVTVERDGVLFLTYDAA